jgi:hypothetical protein
VPTALIRTNSAAPSSLRSSAVAAQDRHQHCQHRHQWLAIEARRTAEQMINASTALGPGVGGRGARAATILSLSASRSTGRG